MTIAIKEDLKCSGERQFSLSLTHLDLTEPKEDYIKVGESQVRTGVQDSQQDYTLS